ncbi:MAG: TolC family protein, partial [Armatimonadetes bacterium]|nr:TolC family protein [Armatimonadota bacterium]
MGQPQPVGAPPFTVEEAVALAIRQNPHLSAAAREVVAARAGVRAARALANPALIFAPAITSAGGSDEELLFQQPLELNGTRAARTGVARANLRVAQAQAIVELRNLVAATKTAYYELARAQEQRSLAVDLLQIAAEIDRITRRQVELGSRAGIEQTQTAIEVARARQQVVLAESQVASARAALNLLLGQTGPDAVGMGLLSPLTFTSEPVDEEAAIRQALAARAEIAGEEASRDAFRHGARLARAEGRPDLAPQLRAESVTRGLNNAGLGIAV